MTDAEARTAALPDEARPGGPRPGGAGAPPPEPDQPPDGAEEIPEETFEAIAENAEYLARYDLTSFAEALARLGVGVLTHPVRSAGAVARFGVRLTGAAVDTTAVALGRRPETDLAPARRDRRFDDPAWERNPWFFSQRQAYLAWGRLVHELVERSGLDPLTAQKAEFAAGLIVDAAAPTNFLPSNPAALRRAFQTGGMSVLRGMQNFFHDVAHNKGRPRQVDTSPFELGRNLAATPGKVVHRNQLMELLQYEPRSPKVFETPMLLSPPWINKYYVMDLAPRRSFVEYAVEHGHTVFAISYRNPDPSMRDIDLDDYLRRGPLEALEVIEEITGSPSANVVGLCIGGTLAAMLLGHLAAKGEPRMRTATLLNTLLDFSEPGPLGAFTDRDSVAHLEQRAAGEGLLHGDDMSATFNVLRDNDLIWNYVASNWLMGEQPPPFDILAWNNDGTNLPVKMMSTYLRACYVENRLAQGTLRLAGTPIHLDATDAPVYVVAAKEDHIVPWKSSFTSARLLGGPVRFVLTSSGHIAGIVNPPSPKRKYWATGDGTLPDDPEGWLAGAEEHPGSWWPDWDEWLSAHAGAKRKPPTMGSDLHPPLDDAPGSYVRG